MYAADGILGSASVRLTLGTGVCSAEHQQLRTECAVIAACSVRTGYVFFNFSKTFLAHALKTWVSVLECDDR